MRFAQAAVDAGHEISPLFLYQDGIHNASSSRVTAQDELNLSEQWSAFIREQRLDAVVCIAAALRRGLLDDDEARRYGRASANLSPDWTLAGLGLLHEALQEADRLLCFGGD